MDVVAAHSGSGSLHLACSAVVFAPDGSVLVQRRAHHKPTFGGRWSNTCCTHPFPGEDPLVAAQRRLVEELGLAVSLHPAGRFRYRAVDPTTAMVEHELDHVLIGNVTERPLLTLDADEVADAGWWTPEEVRARIAADPLAITPWFAMVLELAVSAREAGAA